MSTFIAVFIVFALVFAGLALGLLLSGGNPEKALRGSCGGPDVNPDCCQRRGLSCEVAESASQRVGPPAG